MLYPAELRGQGRHGTVCAFTGSHGQSVRMRTPPPLRLAVLAAVAALLLAACGGSDGAESPTTTAGSGETTESWSFTDDHGTTVELDGPPATIVASPAAAGALYEYGIEVAGILGSGKRLDGTADPALGGVDPESVVALANDAGEVNIEQLAGLRPDVIISDSWGEGQYFGIAPEVLDKAPADRTRASASTSTPARSRNPSPVSPSSPSPSPVSPPSRRAARPKRRSRRLVSGSPRPSRRTRASRCSPPPARPTRCTFAVPAAYPDLEFFGEAGVELVEPDTDEEFWQTLSWEEVNRYHADLILADARFGGQRLDGDDGAHERAAGPCVRGRPGRAVAAQLHVRLRQLRRAGGPHDRRHQRRDAAGADRRVTDSGATDGSSMLTRLVMVAVAQFG